MSSPSSLHTKSLCGMKWMYASTAANAFVVQGKNELAKGSIFC